MDLSGKILAVTGSDGALGRAVAEILTGYGAKLALLSHSKASPELLPAGALALRRSRSDLGGGWALGNGTSVSKKPAGSTGSINIAGGFGFGKFAGGTLDIWDAMYRINLRTAVVSCQAALPYLLQAGGGRIVNVGCGGRRQGHRGYGRLRRVQGGRCEIDRGSRR